MNYYVNNRQVIKNFAINTGTSTSPTFTSLCTTTENTLNVDMEQQDWYDFCSAIQHSIVTGASLSFDSTVKLDINNKAVQELINKVTTLLTTGEIAQFNNQAVQFELLTGVADGVLEYTKYEVPAILNFSELGGAAEDASEFSLTTVINGVGKVVTG